MKPAKQLGPWSYLALFLAPLVLAALAIQHGVSPTLAGLLSMSALALVLLVLERRFPARSEWQRAGREVSVDAVYLGVGSALAGALHQGVFRTGAALLAGRNGPWPGALPMLLQIVLALFVIELGQYAAH